MAERADWQNALAGSRAAGGDLSLVAALKQSQAGSSGAFLASASDGNRYWVKPLNNRQTERVPISEQIVGRAGALIGAPTCEVHTVEIKQDLEGWEFRQGAKLAVGIAHGSRLVQDAAETRQLERRTQDENSARHVFLLALYDWCWGADPQWLMALSDDSRFYSHDHGHYFPGGPNWQEAELVRVVDEPHEFPDSNHLLSREAAGEVAAALHALTRAMLLHAIRAIPPAWPVSNSELECIGFFLERRAPQVADRILRRLGRAT